MTLEEALRFIDPETDMDALAEVEYYKGFKGKEAAGIIKCNELNNHYRWVTFYIDDDADVITQIDSYVDEENCGSVCLSLVRRMVNIIDETYPDIMRTIWGS